MKNQGMVDDYRLAVRRSELATGVTYGCVIEFLLNVILFWPFNGAELLFEGFVTALAIGFGITGRDYRRKAEHIEKAWHQSARLPG